MKHPYPILKPEYERRLSAMVVDKGRVAIIKRTAEKLCDMTKVKGYLPRYLRVFEATGVPAAFIATLDERESGADITRGLGQGDPWNRVSTHVPAGHGPFKSWEQAAIHYIRWHGLDKTLAEGWTMPFVCWKGEGWNGFGPRNRGIATGYLWAMTNQYRKGKYVADGKWNPEHVDTQIGIVPVMLEMMRLVPSLLIAGAMVTVSSPSIVPIQGIPEGVRHAKEVQELLNAIGEDPPLRVDGSYGRLTMAAVRDFQRANGLEADGFAGPITLPVLRAAARKSQTTAGTLSITTDSE